MAPIKKIKGSALLTALFIMTLVAIVATSMSSHLQLDIYRTRLIIMHDKLYLATQALSFWAMEELSKKNKFSKLNKNGMVAIFPPNLKTIDPQIQLSGGIYDLQARFNLNNVIEKEYLSVFASLVSKVPGLNSNDSNNLVLSLKKWLLNFDLSLGKDADTSYYLTQKPPYFPSHQNLASASEFRLIKGVNAETYLSLEPYITALPEPTPININTASKRVLMALGNGLNESKVNELIQSRGEKGITDLKKIEELSKKLDLPMKEITIESQYFLATANAISDEFHLTVYTLLKRHIDKTGQISVSIIREGIFG